MEKMKMIRVFLFLALITPAVLQAAAFGAESSSALPEVKTYEELVSAIRGARAESRTRVEKAVDREKVREAWEIGRLIDAHVLHYKERADYADRTIIRLAKDLGVSETELRYMLQFARSCPIYRPADGLSWSHYEALLAVNDPEERKALTERAVKEKWTRDRLREEVKKSKSAKNGTGTGDLSMPASLEAKPGKPGTYKIVKATVGPETGKVVIDLGFSNYYKTSKDLRFKEGAIIEVTPPFAGMGSSPSDLIRLSRLNESRGTSPESLLYTYRAWAVKVLDGDTLKVVVDLGFGVRSVQVLRLRGLDCPELVSKEGKEAKEFVESVIASPAGAKQSILIKTTKSDKYDRYLADVFYIGKDGKQVYLNNLLLEQGHAVRA